MPILTCRRCHGDGKVESISHYPRKNIAHIVCEKCGKTWYVSTPPTWNKTDIVERCGKAVVSIETDTGTSKVPETAMAIAFAKAAAKKSSKGEPE